MSHNPRHAASGWDELRTHVHNTVAETTRVTDGDGAESALEGMSLVGRAPGLRRWAWCHVTAVGPELEPGAGRPITSREGRAFTHRGAMRAVERAEIRERGGDPWAVPLARAAFAAAVAANAWLFYALVDWAATGRRPPLPMAAATLLVGAGSVALDIYAHRRNENPRG